MITGASSGIGRAIAAGFAAEGARVVMVARGAERLNEAAGALPREGGEALAIPADISKERQVKNVFGRIWDEFGRLDVLVNNAGTASRVRTEELTLRVFSSVIGVNLIGAYLCAIEAFRMMKEAGGGRIINIGSVSARVPRANSVPYTTSKFALEGMTRALALDGRRFNIAVSVIHPGNTESEIWAGNEEAAKREGIMPAALVARVAVLAATLPKGVSLLESVILPYSMPFLGRG